MATTIENITKWNTAIQHADNKNYAESLELFKQINNKSSKIYYNMGCLNVLMKNWNQAIKNFDEALEKDKLLVVAWMQKANVNYILKKYTEAQNDLEAAMKCMPESGIINYHSGMISMRTKVSKCMALHNLAACDMRERKVDSARANLSEASRCQCSIESKHKPSQKAFTSLLKNELFDNITIPLDRFYRPSKAMVKSTSDIDYLDKDKTKLIALKSNVDEFTGFMGPRNIANKTPPPQRRDLPVDERRGSSPKLEVLDQLRSRSNSKSPARPPPPASDLSSRRSSSPKVLPSRINKRIPPETDLDLSMPPSRPPPRLPQSLR